jgi:hypothetical protein
MIDNLSIALSHALIALAAWRLVFRDDLDVEAPPERDAEPQGFFTGRPRRKTMKHSRVATDRPDQGDDADA